MPPDRDPNLENELRDLGRHVEYPSTPDLTSSVKSRLDAGDAPSAPPTRSGPSLWWLAAAALVLLTALPVLSPVVRDMAAGMFSAGAGGMAGGAAESGGQGGGAASSGDQAAGGGSVTEKPTMPSTQGAQAGGASATQGAPQGAADSGLQAARTPNEKRVPDVVGAPVLKACSKLQMRNYVGTVLGEVENDRVEPGHVISQKPRDGRKGFQGQPVELIVSKPYPAEKLGRNNRCYNATEYGPGGRPNMPNRGTERAR